ncbi:NTP/NDP exchange transporter [Allorhodopirellula heiligendammensis]|uniref:Major Facilitator Superfamily protein n=1 Tax=Allorhodopirellula heiligendammensis TaxID=2714739 RepID=A0A5C6C5R5_9BACT|nr:MFS transporter [Allorhodopirellula heiligendammensis]TWU19980.1 Major Facilitator Superfamily protein [Allorhodopirellula heiligendammensis]
MPAVRSESLPPHDGNASERWWSRIRDEEQWAVAWATAWFFFILLGYLIVRPVRETMGSVGSTTTLQWLMLATFAIMLAAVPAYSYLVSRLPRRWLVRVVYHVFAAALLIFFILMRSPSAALQVWTARAFFLWVNVFALFATSVFWSVLADLFTSSQGKRLFGIIAAGGTAGAITGSLITSQLATQLSTSSLLLLPILMIECGLYCAWRLERQSTRLRDHQRSVDDARIAPPDRPDTAGGLLAGITHVGRSPYLLLICAFLVLVQTCGTQLYFQQAEIVSAAFESKQERTQLFAYIDLSTQILTLSIQVFCASAILRRWGVSIALAILPIVYLGGFASLAISQSLGVLVIVMIATRAIGYGVTVPTREVLFTVVSREDKYKSKNFIDTVVLRGGDAVSGQAFGGLRAFGVSLTSLNLIAIPVTILWTVIAWRLGKQQQKMADEASGGGVR